MGIIANFLDKRVDVYSIVNTVAASGQPLENLFFSRKIHIYFNPDRSRFFRLLDPGQIPVDQPSAISEKQVSVNQVLVVDGTKWRVVSSKPAAFKGRTLAYIMSLEHYHH